ncbi:lysozyme inhibitor LprI family protein [Rhizobium sp. C4]|uniref:lysozyme inhibitor LprI family protein n=1 Tax=Rhizobium sp. C4 TaxID=1349800 RepID=UPI001E3CE671|nr:hypothetical protein [Rhizobium sp. C4]MCD2171844.1 hypothetical protein [Rhizobium sp. C4]
MPTRILIVLLGLVLAPSCFAASFDCGKAKSADEVAICGNPELSHRDMIADEMYRKAVEVAGASAAKPLARSALQERAACGSDVACIAKAQQGLVDALAALIDDNNGGVEEGSKINYGSRLGMQVTVTSVRGIGTSRAVVEVEHTREDATTYCRDYVQKVTPKCIQDELAVDIGGEFSGNCQSGEFETLTGDELIFKGVSKTEDMADYEIVVKETGEILDGSSASGYPVVLDQFLTLCPNRR